MPFLSFESYILLQKVMVLLLKIVSKIEKIYDFQKCLKVNRGMIKQLLNRIFCCKKVYI